MTKSRWDWLTPPDHVYHFTPEVLSHFIRTLGFKVELMETSERTVDLMSNFVTAWVRPALIRRVLLKFIKVFGFLFFPLYFIQKRWWKTLKGGLIEIYAVKKEMPDAHRMSAE
jgi:hypothetical protein